MKLNMLFHDRVGIVADISNLLAQHGLNIVSMEVQRKNTQADVYFEVEQAEAVTNREELFEMLGRIPNLAQIRFIETLPQEMREQRFRVVLDNIRDGVISIDRNGRITTINRIARRVLDCEHAELIGKDVKLLNLPDHTILECLEGKHYNNLKKNLILDGGRFQYFSTGRPITDFSGRIVGAVEIDRDMQEIKILAQSISEPGRVTFSDFIGENPLIKQLLSYAQKIAKTESIVSIRGESGTGKELFAQAIHESSERSGPFVPINCAALPEPLLESELFGYIAGAFTGARKEGKPGLFESAGGGSILLDEIGDMPLSVQAKILRVIQEKRVRRIGSSREVPVNTRIITATNRNLEQLVHDKLFREDLYYRINVLPIHIPPLRERPEDIPLLVEHFLFQLGTKLHKHPQTLSREALDKLCHHTWPGNVRELKNVIERAAILCDSDRIDPDYILLSFEVGKTMMQSVSGPAAPSALQEHTLQALLDGYEKQLITETLQRSASVRQAARTLNISHTALLNKLKKHRLQIEKRKPLQVSTSR